MDAVTASLLKEAGVAPPPQRRSTDQPRMSVRSAEAALRDLTDPALEANDSPDQRAQRESKAAELFKIARPQGGSISFDHAPQPAASAPAPAPAANDPITASLLKEASARSTESAKTIPDTLVPPDKDKRDTGYDPRGGPEAVLSAVTGFAGKLIGNVMGVARQIGRGELGTREGARMALDRADEIARSLTYVPRSQEAKNVLEAAGTVSEATGLSRLQGMGPAEAITLGGLMAGGQAARGAPATRGAPDVPAAPTPTVGGISQGVNYDVPTVIRRARPEAPTPAPATVAPTPAAGAPAAPVALGASAGAAGVNVAERAKALAASASPELQAEVAKIGPKITPRGLQVLERHVDAETLPVPIKLTEGQATRDVRKLSDERNDRARTPALADRFMEQNRQLAENLPAIRERAAPDIYVNTPTELGEIVIQAYRAKDDALNASISAKYKALKDANGGQFPMDGVAFADAATAALHKELIFDFTPKAVRKTLDRLREGGAMTFEQFEALRTNMAAIQRSGADGNKKKAAAIVRDALEQMPLTADTAHLKPLADAARAAAKQRFDMLKADRAYNAVVKGQAGADAFIDKYVLGKSADSKAVAKMLEHLAHDDGARQAMASGAIGKLERDTLRGGENFSQSNYNNSLQKLGPKMQILFDTETRGNLDKLGRVARDVQSYPSGHYVNTSNTFVASMGERAKDLAEAAGNRVALGTTALPLGTIIRDSVSKTAAKNQAKRSLKTGAGLTVKEIAEGK